MNDDVLEALACELDKRPAGAPGFGDLAPALRSLRRDGDTLIAEYDPTEASRLAEVVAAERLCCAAIDWRVDGARLTVQGTARQLEALERLLPA